MLGHHFQRDQGSFLGVGVLEGYVHINMEKSNIPDDSEESKHSMYEDLPTFARV